MKPKVIFITGPTASGKSALAVWLAKALRGPALRSFSEGGEIINADSRQVYRGLDVGAAKINRTEMRGVPHHLLSIASPKRDFSLARWLRLADRAVKVIMRRPSFAQGYGGQGRVPIFCGGTLLYLRALREGWVLPGVKPNAKLRRELERRSLGELQQRLRRLDPKRLQTIQHDNPRRLIRAIEIATALGHVPPLQRQPRYEVLTLATQLGISYLERYIPTRLRKRISGTIREVKMLRSIGLSFERIISFGLEYDWFGRYVRGDISLREATVGCTREIIRFSKKQRSSLERLSGVHWVRDRGEAVDYTKRFLAL